MEVARQHVFAIQPESSYLTRLITTFCLHWRLAISIFALVFGAAAAIALLAPNQYKCQMKVLVKNERASPPIGLDQHTSSLLYLDEISEARINSEIEMLTSTDLLREIARQGELAVPGKPALSEGEAVRFLQKHLSVKSVKKANIIDVAYESPDRRRALSVLTLLSRLYLESHLRLNGAPGSYQFFDNQAAEYLGRLQQAENELTAFRERNHIVALGEEKTLALAESASLQKQVLDNDAATRQEARRVQVLRGQITTLQPRITKEIRTLPNQYSVERLNTLLVELRNKRTDLASKYRATDRSVVELDAQIANTEKELQSAGSIKATENTTDLNPIYLSTVADINRAETQLAADTASGVAFTGKLQENQARLKELEQVTSADSALVRRVKELEDTHNLYVQKREEARASDLLDQHRIANVAIAEQPFLPDKAASPNRPLILSMGLLWAVILSVVTLVALSKWSSGMYGPRDFESATGIPVLATVPMDSDLTNSLSGYRGLLAEGTR